MGCGSLMSTAIMHKLGTKTCLVVGGIGNVQWILSTILAAEFQRVTDPNVPGDPHPLIVPALLLCTCINGLTVGVLWACANSYVADCASEDNKGFFFSYYWCFYMTS